MRNKIALVVNILFVLMGVFLVVANCMGKSNYAIVGVLLLIVVIMDIYRRKSKLKRIN